MVDKGDIRWKLRYVGLILYFIFFAIVLPYVALFWGRGVEVELFQRRVFLYWGLGLGAVFAIGLMRWVQSKVDANPKKYANQWGWIRASIFDPEDSILYKSKLTRWIVYPFSNQFLFFFVLWGLIGLIGVISNTAFAPIPQQVSRLGEFIFGVYPASPSETLLECFLIFLVAGFIYWLVVHKAKQSKVVYWIWALFVVPIFAGFLRVVVHTVAYGTDELKFVVAFGFGYIGAIFTLLTNGVLPFLSWHDSNNIYFSLKEVLASDVAVVIVVLSFIFLVSALFLARIFTRKKRES